jgi:hypothetical protein
MSVTNKFTSPDRSTTIIIKRNRLWENVRIFFNGELVKTCQYASETREGVDFDVEDLGNVSLKVHSVTLKPTLLVNGVEFSLEDQPLNQRKLLIPTIIFGILGAINIVFFFIALRNYLERPDWFFGVFAITVATIYMLVYLATTILLAIRVYFFYFVGTALFIFSTIYIALIIYFNAIDWFFLTLFFVRIVVLAVLLGYFKLALRLFRSKGLKSDEQQILDERL